LAGSPRLMGLYPKIFVSPNPFYRLFFAVPRRLPFCSVGNFVPAVFSSLATLFDLPWSRNLVGDAAAGSSYIVFCFSTLSLCFLGVPHPFPANPNFFPPGLHVEGRFSHKLNQFVLPTAPQFIPSAPPLVMAFPPN